MWKESADSKSVVLSYHDCLLRASDVALLEGPHWLNDLLIGFYFEYLDKKTNKDEKKELLFISPELTQLLKLTHPSQYEFLLSSLDVLDSDFVFFPLNNCDRKQSAGGSHWSLLVYSKPEQVCFHFDSSSGFNGVVASEFARSLTSYFLGRSKECIQVPCPQQENGYDCGIYVLCFTDAILDYVKTKKQLKGCDCNAAKSMAATKRSELLHLINELKSTHSS